MRRMIRLVQAAKGTPVYCEGKGIADIVTQRQRAVWHTTMLGLVSAYSHIPFLITYCLVLKHAFCHFLVTPARIWSSISANFCAFSAHWRFYYFHGQRNARLMRDQTVYDKPERERSLLITCLSPLLFFAPEVHLREMEKLWTDEVIIETVWKNFMTKLLAEWQDVILWVRIQCMTHDVVRLFRLT
jgi:hypothetical protein